MSRTTQGKCEWCHEAFRWTDGLKLADAACPRCLRPLKRTTHLFRGSWRSELPKPRTTDRKGYLSTGDAREALLAAREVLAETKPPEGVTLRVRHSAHRVAFEAADRRPHLRASSREPGASIVLVPVLLPDVDVRYAMLCALGAATRDRGEHAAGVSWSSGDWLRSEENRDRGIALLRGAP